MTDITNYRFYIKSSIDSTGYQDTPYLNLTFQDGDNSDPGSDCPRLWVYWDYYLGNDAVTGMKWRLGTNAARGSTVAHFEYTTNFFTNTRIVSRFVVLTNVHTRYVSEGYSYYWCNSTTGNSAILTPRYATNFIQEILTVDKITFQICPYSEGTKYAQFDLTGLKEVLLRYTNQCMQIRNIFHSTN